MPFCTRDFERVWGASSGASEFSNWVTCGNEVHSVVNAINADNQVEFEGHEEAEGAPKSKTNLAALREAARKSALPVAKDSG